MHVVRTSSGWAVREDDKLHRLDDAPWNGGARRGSLDTNAELLVPVVPSKIVCVGRNYAAHAAELGNEVPKEPLLFLKPPSSLLAHRAAIELPPESERVEHEGELAIVIGRGLRRADAREAEACIFGYTAANDITARDIQRSDVQFTRGKGFDTFCPLGPEIRTDLDPRDLAVQVEVNGELRQDGRTSAMIHDPFALVSYISHVMSLLPGDLILTGTPAGVGPLAAGDEVVVRIEGLQELSNPVRNPA